MQTVCVLMSTYNGTKYLKEQIASIKKQKNVDVRVLVRDDNSIDETQLMLEKYKDSKFSWYKGENLGPAGSFLDLIQKAPEADYYAFCDQDDIWLDDKLDVAITNIESCVNDKEIPGLYFSNVDVVDSELKHITYSNIDTDVENLHYALLHNRVIGCTTVFNRQLMKRLQYYTPTYIFMHDWWIYQVCLVLKGCICFDEKPHILYRQHAENSVGYKRNKINIFNALFKKSNCTASRMAKELIKGYGHLMSSDVYEIVETVAFYQSDLNKKIKFLSDNKFYKSVGKNKILEQVAIIRNRK